MGLFEILVIASGLAFIAALFNSLINKYKKKWYPFVQHTDVFIEKFRWVINPKFKTENSVKTFSQIFDEVGFPITIEGLLSFFILVAVCIIYVISVYNFL